MKYGRTLDCLVFVILGSISPVSNAAAPSGEGLSLKISLAAGQSEFLPLMPVVIRIELANESGTTRTTTGAGLGVVGSRYYSIPPRHLFAIRTPDGSTKTVHLSDWVEWFIDAPEMPSPTRSLAAGDVQFLEYTLGLGVENLSLPRPEYREIQKQATPVFSLPGDYQVRLALPRFNPPVESNVLTIQIRNPEKPADVRAHDILSRSAVPELFLTPPKLYEAKPGIIRLDSRRLHQIRDSGTTSPLETCRQILANCPESSYAPYAQWLLGAGLCVGWERSLSREPGKTLNVDHRTEGVRLLYQTARDVILPARTREQACLILRYAAKRIDSRLKSEARKTAPSLEQVLGVDSVDLGGIPSNMSDIVFRVVFEMTRGSSDWKTYEKILNGQLTPQQMETLITAVTTNELIQRAHGFSPLQLELQGYINWATQELRKLPWRDPDTGLLTMAGRPGSQP